MTLGEQQQQQYVGSNGLSEIDRLWNLLSELSSQLSQNRQQTEDLHRRAEELKTQAIHTQTGFTLRRFNVDISKEEFESQVERLNVTLVLENQSLQVENRQLSTLLKDYEGTLEAVMAKFRVHAYSSQQHHLALISHYESILLALPSASSPTSNSPLPSSMGNTAGIDPLHLSLSLAHLASLIRKALRSMQGEDPEDEESAGSPSLAGRDYADETDDEMRDSSEVDDQPVDFSLMKDMSASALGRLAKTGPKGRGQQRSSKTKRDVSEGGYIGSSASTSPHHLPTTSLALIPSHLLAAPLPSSPSSISESDISSSTSSPPATTNSSINPSNTPSPHLISTSTSTLPFSTPAQAPSPLELFSKRRVPIDLAMERDIELETLRKENEQLRKMLNHID